MRAVSIQDFIDEVFELDSSPPAESTIRRLCFEGNESGEPAIPGAFKMGKAWKIDLDCYYRTMEKRLYGREASFQKGTEEEARFIDQLARRLSAPN